MIWKMLEISGRPISPAPPYGGWQPAVALKCDLDVTEAGRDKTGLFANITGREASDGGVT